MSIANDFGRAVLLEASKSMFGVDHVIRLSLVALCTGGHILLEAAPGFGKTELVKTLGRVLHLPFGRIQFTPDLMPSDITGTYIPAEMMPGGGNGGGKRLTFMEGPVFTSLLLADEINRATPKTQSAMLEAMAENQVTVLGKKRELPLPFMVMATQNPIDQEGTYELPEAQSDRFMFKAIMPIPDENAMRRILEKQTGAMSTVARDAETPAPDVSLSVPNTPETATEKIAQIRKIVKGTSALPSVEIHAINMYLASQGQFGKLEKIIGKKRVKLAEGLVDFMLYGLGPRAVQALLTGAKAWKTLFEPDTDRADGRSLCQVAIPALRHRIRLSLDWEDRYRETVKSRRGTARVSKSSLLRDFILCCAPDSPKQGEYFASVKRELSRPVSA